MQKRTLFICFVIGIIAVGCKEKKKLDPTPGLNNPISASPSRTVTALPSVTSTLSSTPVLPSPTANQPPVPTKTATSAKPTPTVTGTPARSLKQTILPEGDTKITPTRTTPEPTSAPPDRLLDYYGRHWSARLAASRDGKALAIAYGNDLCLYSLPEMQADWCTLVDRTGAGFPISLANNPQDQTLALGLANGRIVLVEAKTGAVQRVIQASADNIRSLVWSPDGILLASGSDETEVKIWNIQSGERVGTLLGDESSILALAWSPDGSTIAGGTFFGNVYIWNAVGGTRKAEWKAPQGYNISSLAWAGDGSCLYAGASFAPGCGECYDDMYDGSVERLDGNTLETLSEWDAGYPVQALALRSDEDALAIGLTNGSLRLLSADLSRVLAETTGVWRETGLVWLPSNELLFFSRARLDESRADISRFPAMIAPDQLLQWNPASGRTVDMLLPGGESVSGPVWSPDGETLAAGTPSGNILFWDMVTGLSLPSLTGEGGFSPAAWSPDGSRFARLDGAGSVVLFNADTWEMEQVLEGGVNPSKRLLWSPDGKWLASADWESIIVWDVESGKIVFQTSSDSADAVAWSPGGSRLAVVDNGEEDSQVRIWDVQSGNPVKEMKVSGWITNLDWAASPSGDRIAIAQGGWAEVWDVETGERLLQLSADFAGHSWGIERVALSRDGTVLATAAAEIILWDVTSGKKLERLEGHTEAVIDLSFSPDGRRLASASFEGVVIVWDIGR